MTVYYFQPFLNTSSVIVSYPNFGGSVKVIAESGTEINVAEIAYADFGELTAPLLSSWAYALFWNASISQPTNAKDSSRKTYNSQPLRYDFGHVTTFDSLGVAWDETLKFEDQKVPTHRTHIVDGQPNTGGIPIDFDTPVDADAIYSWTNNSIADTLSGLAIARANSIGIYLRSAPECIVAINYYATLMFDAATIVVTNPLVGIFP